ncbi:MAG TPA: hypothetical protein DHV48_07080 [Prolixibacteraceae bacterium]|nr:hypothetical protein [Prolixibacteraceae bacterium]
MIESIKPYLILFISRYQHDISVYDDTFLKNTITDRQAELGLYTDREYLNYLENNIEEAAIFKGRLSNSYSEFFRNPLTFAYLAQVVLPELIKKKKNRKEKEIRIWSAACAAGQEAYSLAILCDELIDRFSPDIHCRIFGTDISTDALDQARKGVFQSPTLGKVSLKRIQSYFTRDDEVYTIVPSFRECIDFSVFDLLSENGSCPPASIYGNFDLVFCSNLLFYYKTEIRNRVLEKIGNSLARGGFLVTSETEREIVTGNYYREVFDNSAIFQKR